MLFLIFYVVEETDFLTETAEKRKHLENRMKADNFPMMTSADNSTYFIFYGVPANYLGDETVLCFLQEPKKCSEGNFGTFLVWMTVDITYTFVKWHI